MVQGHHPMPMIALNSQPLPTHAATIDLMAFPNACGRPQASQELRLSTEMMLLVYHTHTALNTFLLF